MLEIELKARILDPQALQKSLQEHGFTEQERLVETDHYYQGVDRDFHVTDEALRLRFTKSPDGAEKPCVLTYKGPNLDAVVKTREEIEVELLHSENMARLLTRLGHKAVRHVKKTRVYYMRGDVTACVDEVEGLDTFLELEVLRHENEREQAVSDLLHLLTLLDVEQTCCTRKSYLEMLLEKDRNHRGIE